MVILQPLREITWRERDINGWLQMEVLKTSKQETEPRAHHHSFHELELVLPLGVTEYLATNEKYITECLMKQ